jgi:hypothetical protein
VGVAKQAALELTGHKSYPSGHLVLHLATEDLLPLCKKTATLTQSVSPTPGLPACYSGTPTGLLPSDDTFIKGDSPLNNYGNDTTFDVRPANGADRRGLLKFDLSSIPQNATVNSATLYLFERDNKAGRLTYLYRVTSNWNENTVTWLTWTLLGGDFDSSVSYFTYIPDQKNCRQPSISQISYKLG